MSTDRILEQEDVTTSETEQMIAKIMTSVLPPEMDCWRPARRKAILSEYFSQRDKKNRSSGALPVELTSSR